MKIKIAHLYYDLLNLYGEQGNILALKNAFENQNVKVEINLPLPVIILILINMIFSIWVAVLIKIY